MSRPTILIPVAFPDPAPYPLADMHLEGLSSFEIVLSGYWEVPSQLPVTEAREAHKTEADAVLYEMATHFSRAGAPTEIQLQFGRPGAPKRTHQTRLAREIDADGVLLAAELPPVSNILVPLRDSRRQTEIVEFVSKFHSSDLFALELYHVTADETGTEQAREMLQTVEETLLSRGFSEADIEITVESANDPTAAIAATARDHNLVVMGETEQPNTEGQLFGPVCSSIADTADRPIVVVRK
ncbi:universal stress protein [Halovenus rubra]|uniref:Universal stress protein n=2 Tax=Halovenus rubra TaxID=869890 RepID=A0ACC7E127_9EURY|nr:universal stress protein [Halovenus rubra]